MRQLEERDVQLVLPAATLSRARIDAASTDAKASPVNRIDTPPCSKRKAMLEPLATLVSLPNRPTPPRSASSTNAADELIEARLGRSSPRTGSGHLVSSRRSRSSEGDSSTAVARPASGRPRRVGLDDQCRPVDRDVADRLGDQSGQGVPLADRRGLLLLKSRRAAPGR